MGVRAARWRCRALGMGNWAGMPADQTTAPADQDGVGQTERRGRRTERRWGLGRECVIYSRCLSRMASTLEVAECARRG